MKRSEYIEEYLKRYGKSSLPYLAFAFDIAGEVAHKFYHLYTSETMLDDIIQEMLLDESIPVDDLDDLMHPAFKEGLRAGLSAMSYALEYDHRNTSKFIKEAFDEGVSRG
jgi:hypothetical protein